ncbi:hypothetical protein [Acidovorax sp.]|uniref:hypothetical protein n=1 Tax=Acidovorax sp. TaxID=1872122 RepID=UPI003D08CCEF
MPTTPLQCTILVAAAMASATAAARTYNDYLVVSEAKQAAADALPDPKSVRFRGLFLSEHGDSKITLCGEINGKDRMGRYTGFRRFLVEDTLDSMFDPQAGPGATPGEAMLQGIFGLVHQRVCSNKVKDVR